MIWYIQNLGQISRSLARLLKEVPQQTQPDTQLDPAQGLSERLWGDVSNFLVDIIDREKELREAESTLEEWWARFIIVEKIGLRVLKQ